MFHFTNHTLTCSQLHTLYNTHSDLSEIAEYCLAFITVLADSYFTEPALVFLVIVLPCLFSRVQILVCVFWITLSYCRSDSVCPCLGF